MSDGKLLAIITTRTFIYLETLPSSGRALAVSFTRKGNQMTGTIALSPVNPADHVTSRQVTVTLNGTALPPIEAVSSPATFTAADGDTYSISVVDSNSVGAAAPGPLLTGTASLPLSVPTPGFATAVVFTP